MGINQHRRQQRCRRGIAALGGAINPSLCSLTPSQERLAFQQSRGALQGNAWPLQQLHSPQKTFQRAPAAVRSNTPPRWLVRLRLATTASP